VTPLPAGGGAAAVDVTEVFRAMSDPVRLRLLGQLARYDEVSRHAVQESLALPKAMLTYHAKILIEAGLVDVRKCGRRLVYALRPGAVAEVYELLEDLERGATTRPHSGTRPAGSLRLPARGR
jgi:DNA-binding transcriptional ArsR family regulator